MNVKAQVGKYVASAVIEFVFLVVFLFILLYAGEIFNKSAVYASLLVRGSSSHIIPVDQNPIMQFVYFLINIFTGNWGYLPKGFPYFSRFSISGALSLTLPVTAFLMVISVLVSVPIVIALGVRYGKRVHSTTSIATSTYTGLGVAVPVFFLAILARLAFQSTPLGTTGINSGTHVVTWPTHVPIIDALISGNLQLAWTGLLHFILPFLLIVFFSSALLLRTYRAGILKALDSGYLASAKSLGLPPWIITRRYLMNTGTSEILRHISSIMTSIFTFEIIIETVFLYQGVGWLFFQSVLTSSYTGIIGSLLIFGIGLITVRLVARIARAYIDPKNAGRA